MLCTGISPEIAPSTSRTKPRGHYSDKNLKLEDDCIPGKVSYAADGSEVFIAPTNTKFTTFKTESRFC